MRVGRLLVLLAAFAVGIGSAFVVAFFTLDAKPKVVVDKGPTVKILVAKTPIAVGEEITAEALVFQEVAVRDLPEGSMANFFQVYRRRPVYPIAPGCPICEDLLIPKTTDTETVKYVPVGSQIVVLEIEQVRVNREATEIRLPITQVLSIEDSIDVRAVQRSDAQGELAERKNNILRVYAPEKTELKEEIGELILEDIPIYDVRSSGQAIEGRQYQTVSLLLENDQIEKLHQAARDGRLRIALHTELSTEPTEEPEPENPQTAVLETTVSESELVQNVESRPPPVRLIGVSSDEQLTEHSFAAIEKREVPDILPTASFVAPKPMTIRNEPMTIEQPTVAAKPATKSAVVGLIYVPEGRSQSGYSPFNTQSRAVEVDTEEPTVPQPLPVRKRFQ
jgi:Flp pilus assembly protein CpaB